MVQAEEVYIVTTCVGVLYLVLACTTVASSRDLQIPI